MTDLEFLERPRRELTTGPAWNDLGRVVTTAEDPALAGNELRVYELPEDPASTTVSVFRIIIEWEVGDVADAAPSQFNHDHTHPSDEEPDGTIT